MTLNFFACGGDNASNDDNNPFTEPSITDPCSPDTSNNNDDDNSTITEPKNISPPQDINDFRYSYEKKTEVQNCLYNSFYEKYMVVKCDKYYSTFTWSSSDSSIKGVLVAIGSFSPEDGKAYSSHDTIYVIEKSSGSYYAGEIIYASDYFTIYTFDSNYEYSKGIKKDYYIPQKYCYSGWFLSCI